MQFCILSAHQVALRGVTTARGDVWLHLPLLFVLSAHCENKCVALGECWWWLRSEIPESKAKVAKRVESIY